MVPTWVPIVVDGADSVGLAVGAPLDVRWTWTAQVKVRLGSRVTSWTEDVVLAGAPAVHLLAAPPEAFLHDLAADYVSDVRVDLVALDDEGRERWRAIAPPLFLAWPAGREGGPRWWDEGQMRASAPAGVVSERVRAELGDLTGIDRVGAPLASDTPSAPADEER